MDPYLSFLMQLYFIVDLLNLQTQYTFCCHFISSMNPVMFCVL